MKKNRPFHKLTVKMLDEGVTQADLAKAFGTSTASVSRRFSGSLPWDLDWVYTTCDLLGVPYIDIPFYFPPKIVKGSAA